MNEVKGVCPVCNGSRRVQCPENRKQWKNCIVGYNEKDDTLPCNNCGGQYMNSNSTGEVRLNREGVPCIHQYSSENVGRCLTEYTCQHCGEQYKIDSGD